jgi:hypothetical protein
LVGEVRADLGRIEHSDSLAWRETFSKQRNKSEL